MGGVWANEDPLFLFKGVRGFAIGFEEEGEGEEEGEREADLCFLRCFFLHSCAAIRFEEEGEGEGDLRFLHCPFPFTTGTPIFLCGRLPLSSML